MIQCPYWNYENTDVYHEKSSVQTIIHKIEKPTLFLNSLDDPVISSKSLNFEMFSKNGHVILGTTKFGGHLGFNESLFNLRVWYMKPALKFFNAYLE